MKAPRLRFAVLLALVALVAFAVREQFVLFSTVDAPIRGDTRENVAYALNLVEFGTFSRDLSADHAPVPDAYRSPGYPWLLALGMALFSPPTSTTDTSGWYWFVLQLQVLLGAASAVLAGLLARQWLSPGWAAGAGLLLALWPHHIAASGALLSEVVFGFALLAALYCLARGWRDARLGWYAAAAVAFGYAWLVNPILMLFPPCVALALWLLRQRKAAVLLLAIFLVPVVGNGVRSAGLESGSLERARINFVQGSWPLYHAAANRFRIGDPVAIAIMQEIDRENALLARDPVEGLKAVADRFGNDPLGFASWYAFGKPALLWSWQIRIGASDLTVLRVRNSPLERNAPLRAIVAGYKAVNPVLTAIMIGAALVLLWLGFRNPRHFPAAAVAGLALYLTFFHTLLQAEPRYAIAYRGLEAVLVATALAWAVQWLRNRPEKAAVSSSGAAAAPK